MSAFPSAYLDDRILESIFKNVAFTPPTNLYLALFTEDPTAAGTGDEVTGGSYARKAITFAASSGGTISSNNSQSFTGMPDATVTHYGVYDASSGGNLLVYGALPTSVVANAGDEVSIASGAVDFSISGS